MTWLVRPSPTTTRRRRDARSLGASLAILALLIQSVLPLADAALHATFNIAADGVYRAAAAPASPVGTIEALSKQAPAATAHDCPICQFISSVGSFSPPAPARAPEPAPVNLFAVWPTAPPAARSADATAAQPRAPPAAI
jgi:hypothetical protein